MLKTHGLKIIVAVIALTASFTAYSKDAYIAASLGFMDYEETVDVTGFTPVKYDSSVNSLNVRLGKNYTEYFSAEVRLGVGLGDDRVKADGLEFGANLEMREMYGVYARGGMRLDERFYPYVIVGYSQAKLEAITPGFEIDGDFGGLSYGLGVDIDIKQQINANIEYMSYFDTVGIEVTGFSVGLSRSF